MPVSTYESCNVLWSNFFYLNKNLYGFNHFTKKYHIFSFFTNQCLVFLLILISNHLIIITCVPAILFYSLGGEKKSLPVCSLLVHFEFLFEIYYFFVRGTNSCHTQEWTTCFPIHITLLNPFYITLRQVFFP